MPSRSASDAVAVPAASELVARARDFAAQAHGRIARRGMHLRQPYQEHLKAVAQLVMEVTNEPATIAAAWLHDVVEETTTTFGDLERVFGPAVAGLVAEITAVSKPSDGDRATRKAIDLRHLAQASTAAQNIKLADLTDTCRDLSRRDPGLARTELPEAQAVLNVLSRGDATLQRRAQKALAACAQLMGSPTRPPAPPVPIAPAVANLPPQASHKQRHAQRVFTSVFTARDIAEPLRSFALQQPASEIAQVLAKHALAVAAVRGEGMALGYVQAHSLDQGLASDHLRPFAPGQLLPDWATLSEVIGVLVRHDFCFVTAMGEVCGVITRADMRKPVVRMWLFGIITLTEMDFTARVRALWPDGGWTRLLPVARLGKAQALLDERRRRGQQPDLLDCLQLADKAMILMQDPAQLAAFGFATKGAAQRVLKDLESLRNNLAHAQDIVTHDWLQIARLASRVEDALGEG